MDKRTDIWALGCVLYELLTGQQAFDPSRDRQGAGHQSPDRKGGDNREQGIGNREQSPDRKGGGQESDPRDTIADIIGAVTGVDLWVLPLAGERKPRLFLRTPSTEMHLAFSPNGRRMAYISDESGKPEVYIQPYPGPGGKWQISTDGGVEPVWARSGQELFYRNGNKMMAVEIRTEPTFSAGTPRVLFEGQYESVPWAAGYDVTADGQRFLMVKAEETEAAQSQLHVVVDWFEELKRRVPVP